MKLLFVSLGCDKNLVDSEYMIGMLTSHGIELTDDETEADIIIVNSCCFIGDAKEESINTILEMACLLYTSAMLAELDSVKTGQVTYAVRDTEIDGMQIRQNDYMGIGDKAILAVGTDLKETTMKMIRCV